MQTRATAAVAPQNRSIQKRLPNDRFTVSVFIYSAVSSNDLGEEPQIMIVMVLPDLNTLQSMVNILDRPALVL
jgi:hypothetical protein